MRLCPQLYQMKMLITKRKMTLMNSAHEYFEILCKKAKIYIKETISV